MNLFTLNSKSASEILKNVSEVFISNNKKYKQWLLYYQFQELRLKKYFENFIIETLLTDDYVVDKLDLNEFGFKDNLIYKKDIIDENTFYGEMTSPELKRTLTKEFEKFILDIIEESKIVIDIENHLNVFVDINDINENKIRIYSVFIRYWRNDIIEQNNKILKKKAISGGLIISILIGIVTYLIFNVIL